MYTQIILLLFALHSLSAYTVVQIELKNGTEVSEVKEVTKNTIEFTSPDSGLPTLREIIFVVEECGEPEEKDSRINRQETSLEIESPIEIDPSLRPFTNGHGYQFAGWELIDEHQSHADDKAIDRTDNGSDSGDDVVDHDDSDDETDKHDDYHEDTVPVVVPHHLDIEMAKESRNKMFDKMKEKYQSIKRSNINPTEKLRRKRQLNYQTIPGAAYNADPTAFPDYMNRVLVNRPSFDNSKQVISPFRDENVNNLYDNYYNMNNNVFADGRQFANVPRAYGTNLNADQRYSLNYMNNMQNEPTYNQYFSQPVQQRPIESHTVNNNPYKQIKQPNNPDGESRNVKRTPTLEKNEIDSIQKFNQAPNYKPLNRVPKESENKNKNVTQIIDKENVRNIVEANMTLRNNVEMKNSVNQMSKKMSSIKGKVKDRITNINGILNTPEGRKLLSYAMNMAGDRVGSSNDITVQQVNLNDNIPRDSKNLTKTDKPENKSNRIIGTNNVGDTKNIRTSFTNDGDNSFIGFVENAIKEINLQKGKSTVNQNYNEINSNQIIVEKNYNQLELPSAETLTATSNETKNIEKEKESSLFQTLVGNKYDQSKPSTTEKLTGTDYKTMVIEKDKEFSPLQAIIENRNEIPEFPNTESTETRNETTNIEKEKESSLFQTIVGNKYDQSKSYSTEFTSIDNKTMDIEKDKESTLAQTILENKYDQPEPPAIKTFTASRNETTNIENDNESLLVETNAENKRDQSKPLTTETLTCNETIKIEKGEESLQVEAIVENKRDQPDLTTKTLTATGNKTTNIQKDKESSLIQTTLENKYDQPEPPTIETLTATRNEPTNMEEDKESLLVETIVENEFAQPEPSTAEIFNGTGNKPTNIEKDKESSLFSITSENLNDTSAKDIKEERHSELIEEITTETFTTNKTNAACNNKEKCDIDKNKMETNFENLNLYDFLNKEKFYADNNKIDNNSENLHLDELFNKDEFWKWLSKWTTAYMEIINENVETIVKEEVAKQMEETRNYSRTEKRES